VRERRTDVPSAEIVAGEGCDGRENEGTVAVWRTPDLVPNIDDESFHLKASF
jgi:hypothetical protein